MVLKIQRANPSRRHDHAQNFRFFFPPTMPKVPKPSIAVRTRTAPTGTASELSKASSSKSKATRTRHPSQPKFDYDLAYENLDLRVRPEVRLSELGNPRFGLRAVMLVRSSTE